MLDVGDVPFMKGNSKRLLAISPRPKLGKISTATKGSAVAAHGSTTAAYRLEWYGTLEASFHTFSFLVALMRKKTATGFADRVEVRYCVTPELFYRQFLVGTALTDNKAKSSYEVALGRRHECDTMVDGGDNNSIQQLQNQVAVLQQCVERLTILSAGVHQGKVTVCVLLQQGRFLVTQ